MLPGGTWQDGPTHDKPDLMVVKGWRKHTQEPTGPVRREWEEGEEGLSVQLILGELKYTDDQKMARKHLEASEKYMPLVDALRGAGWAVQGEVATIVVGHRACVSVENRRAFEILGIDKKQHGALQERLAASAAYWATSIIGHTKGDTEPGMRGCLGMGLRAYG